MSRSAQEIFKRFPTERYKRFWYPTRPLFTLFFGLFLTGLGFLGLAPLSWALWFAAAFAFDDLLVTPITAMFTAINNFLQGRKTLKAMVMIAALTVAIIAGAGLGYFVVAQSPFAVKLITDYITLSSCSPILISLGAILGAYVAHATHKISPFMGFAFGIAIASFIPFSPPLLVEILFLSIATCTFVTSVVTKQALRAYFKYRYGESNADGYEMARSPEKQAEFIQGQAEKFGVTTEQFQQLTQHCKERVATIKSKASFVVEFTGARNYVTNSYKDIYHGLMNSKLSPDDVIIVKELINHSTLAAENNTPLKRTMADSHFIYGTFFHYPVEERILGHQFKIAEGGGLDQNLTEPFRMTL